MRGGIVNIWLDGQNVEQVSKFKYLGSWITDGGKCEMEIKCQIAMAKEKFNSMKELMTKGLSRVIRKQIVRTCVWSVALYGCETWAIRLQDRRILEAFEMRILGENGKNIVYNEEVLSRVGEKRTIMSTLWARKRNWIGHVIRHGNFLTKVIEGRMEGKRGQGRKRIGMLDAG